MIDIQTALQNIMNAKYGKDVRQSIHDAIEQIDSNANEAIDTAEGYKESAKSYAEEAQAQVALIDDQVDLAKAEVVKAEAQVDLAKAEVVKCENQVDLAKAEVTKASNQVDLAKAEVTKASQEVTKASNEADRAKSEADRASAIVGIGTATIEKAGIVKPDGSSITIDEDGTIHGSSQSVKTSSELSVSDSVDSVIALKSVEENIPTNLIPAPYQGTGNNLKDGASIGGIIVENPNNGTIHFSGTCTTNYTYPSDNLIYNGGTFAPLEIGKTYELSYQCKNADGTDNNQFSVGLFFQKEKSSSPLKANFTDLYFDGVAQADKTASNLTTNNGQTFYHKVRFKIASFENNENYMMIVKLCGVNYHKLNRSYDYTFSNLSLMEYVEAGAGKTITTTNSDGSKTSTLEITDETEFPNYSLETYEGGTTFTLSGLSSISYDYATNAEGALLLNMMSKGGADVPIATASTAGIVKIGEGINVTADGKISAGIPDVDVATTENAGIVKPDGETITISEDGTISSVGGSGEQSTELHIYTTESSLFGLDVTATLSGNEEGLTEVVSGKFNASGFCKLNVHQMGTYTIACSDSEGTYSQSIRIDSFTIKKVTITKFTATIIVNMFGGAVPDYSKTFNVKAVSNSKTYETGDVVCDSEGNISINVGEAGTYDVYAIPRYETFESSHASVNVTEETTYHATLKVAQVTFKVICESSSSLYVKDSDGKFIIYDQEYSEGGTLFTFCLVKLDTYTIMSTIDGVERTETLVVDEYKNYWVELSGMPDGKTVTPTDNVQTWLKCAKISKTYTTISEVLADTSTLASVIADNNASDYLARSTTWATDVCSNEDAMTYMGLDNYCANKLLGVETWLNAICDSTYIEKVLNVKVPTMTSDTTPSGEAIGGYADNYKNAFYMAFDGNNETIWNGKNNSVDYEKYGWVGYKFTKPTNIKATSIILSNTYNYSALANSGEFYIGASNNGTDWENISGTLTWTKKTDFQNFPLENNRSFEYYKIVFMGYTTPNAGGNACYTCATLQFYGREEA